ncbi:MAG: hypothetical protein JW895_06185 [Thermoleophilaceae bacterium]|nr:hypothetical protein [Thermoleophilaceae bacterium]
MGSERGQATVEWVGVVLLVCLLAGAVLAAARGVDGRGFGGALAHRIACAARGGCDDGDAELARAYGPADAALVREHAPGIVYEPGERQLPVDYAGCRVPDCAVAPDDGDLDAHRTDAGRRATVFTHVVRRRGSTHLQYWLYYPDSNTAWAGSDGIWRRSPLLRLAGRVLRGTPEYPGFHRDDWEAYAVRIDRRGRVRARASSHGAWQRWLPSTGWTRVSRGSHAGHPPAGLPGLGLRERTSTAEGLRLVPLETRDRRGYRPNDDGVTPPWRKEAYRNPESDRS